jgi:hypothetical protein
VVSRDCNFLNWATYSQVLGSPALAIDPFQGVVTLASASSRRQAYSSVVYKTITFRSLSQMHIDLQTYRSLAFVGGTRRTSHLSILIATPLGPVIIADSDPATHKRLLDRNAKAAITYAQQGSLSPNALATGTPDIDRAAAIAIRSGIANAVVRPSPPSPIVVCKCGWSFLVAG